jgi:hypothetical protein
MQMKRVLLTVFAGAALASISLAQSTTPPASGSTPEQQTPAAAPSQTMPESSAQPQSQTPEPQEAPPAQEPSTAQPSATQPTDQPPAANRQVPTPGASPSGAPKLAPGSVIPVLLTKGIDAKKAKTGDEVIAKVTQDMKTSGGDVLVPKDTKVIGHVTEAQARSKEQKESQVGLSFDRAVMKNGNEMQLPMSIQAVIGQENNNANAAGGNDQPSSAPAAGAGGGMAGGSGKASGAGGGYGAPANPSASTGSNAPSDAQTSANARGPITAQTQGVVGISNLKLSTTTEGSVLSSEKNNVKLDSGTMMLLKVNQ